MLNKGLSVYLDLLRFIAAVAVVLSHASYTRYTAIFPDLFRPFGHDAVIVFFVLSGFVIAWVSLRRENSLRDYALSRAARIYSVAAPAIVLTILLETASGWIEPALHAYQLDRLWLYVPYWLAFGTDWWLLNEDMLSNSPFWSLSYEVWYYVIFGALFYLRSWTRWLCAGIAMAIVGPRQWLLFPIWLAGCALYYGHERWTMTRRMARWIFVGTVLTYSMVKYFGGFDAVNGIVDQLFGGWPSKYLRYSQFFVGDYLIGALVVANMLSARYCDFSWSGGLTKLVRLAASFTFSLYLFHMPLLKFYALVFHVDRNSFASWSILLASVLASVVLLGMVTEWRKASARRWLNAVFCAMQKLAYHYRRRDGSSSDFGCK